MMVETAGDAVAAVGLCDASVKRPDANHSSRSTGKMVVKGERRVVVRNAKLTGLQSVQFQNEVPSPVTQATP